MRLPNGFSKMSFFPAISCRPKPGYSDFEGHRIESENPRTSNDSAEVAVRAISYRHAARSARRLLRPKVYGKQPIPFSLKCGPSHKSDNFSSIAEGLAAKVMRRAVADLNPAVISRVTLLAVSLRILLQRTRTEMPRIYVPQLKLSKETQKSWGRHVGITEWLLVWLIANALFVVWRVLVVSQAECSRFIGPQRRRWTTSFSTSPAGSARAISPEMRASRLRLRRKSRPAMSAICPYVVPYRVCSLRAFLPTWDACCRRVLI